MRHRAAALSAGTARPAAEQGNRLRHPAPGEAKGETYLWGAGETIQRVLQEGRTAKRGDRDKLAGLAGAAPGQRGVSIGFRQLSVPSPATGAAQPGAGQRRQGE